MMKRRERLFYSNCEPTTERWAFIQLCLLSNALWKRSSWRLWWSSKEAQLYICFYSIFQALVHCVLVLLYVRRIRKILSQPFFFSLTHSLDITSHNNSPHRMRTFFFYFQELQPFFHNTIKSIFIFINKYFFVLFVWWTFYSHQKMCFCCVFSMNNTHIFFHFDAGLTKIYKWNSYKQRKSFYSVSYYVVSFCFVFLFVFTGIILCDFFLISSFLSSTSLLIIFLSHLMTLRDFFFMKFCWIRFFRFLGKFKFFLTHLWISSLTIFIHSICNEIICNFMF